MRKLYLIATVVAIGLVACNKKSEVSNQLPMQKAPAVDLSSLNNGERVFTDEQIEQIGKIHNEAVIEMVRNFNYEAENVYEAFVNQVSRYDIHPMEIAELPLGVSSEKYYSDVLQANLSEKAHKFIYDVADVCVNFDNVDDVETYIETQKKFAKEYFKGVELDGVLIALTVFKYSSQLWFDTTEGGMGLGIALVEYYEKTERAGAPNKAPMKISERAKDALKQCLIADGVGAVTAAVGVAVLEGLGAITVPGAVSVLLSAGVGAALASYAQLTLIIGQIIRGELSPAIDPNKPDIVIKWKDYISVDDKLITFPILVNPHFPVKPIK